MRVVVGMATMNGREEQVKRAIDSLYKQVDDIHIYHNDKMPEDYTDNAKFHSIIKYKKPTIFLTCDDDLIYSDGYVDFMLEGLEKHGCIVTIHGRKLLGLGRNYYKGHSAFACHFHYPQTCEIDVSGTGVTAFRTDYFYAPDMYKAEEKRMSDLVFAREAAKQGKKIMHLGHKQGLVTQQPIPMERTIYGMEHKNCEIQNKIADEIYSIKYF